MSESWLYFDHHTLDANPCTAYELDVDDLDDEAIAQLETTRTSRSPRSTRSREQSIPLLVGLLDSASARRNSVDGTLLLELNGNVVEDEPPLDLEALAAKRLAGGGMLDSVANMANSILGAGKLKVSLLLLNLPHDGQESLVNCFLNLR